MGGGGKGGSGLWTLGEGAREGMGCGVNHDWCLLGAESQDLPHGGSFLSG